ncbi:MULTISPECIES: amidohydrolase [Limnochorda]|uniref:amidohydrolase n=1 Tax=Limnochorda TaxID=1676651 RepID=UPI00181B5CAA|nr:amidohydrolase [Limnochorda pilosa]MBO2486406.1 N-ethylammeline chlorohydrolase [Bacillota bacterium]MBO2518593.1 N-ethylammeline chlorohydrolase [Bacillota bacterium]NMA70310.1 amidohydrolase [Bacillota bacterium]
MKVIRGGRVWLGAAEGFREGLEIVVEGSRITDVRPSQPDQPTPSQETGAREAEVIDATGHLVLPGFVNAHTHAAMTLLRSYADDMALHPWLTEAIWPAEARMTPEDIYWGSLLAIIEMIRGGTTAFADMYFFEDQTARAVAESGIRAALAPGLVDGEAFEARLQTVRELAATWHGEAGGRIRIMVGPHAPYTASQGLSRAAELAGELGLAIHIHLSETRKEVEESLAQHGLTPIQVAERAGVFQVPTLAAHCVHVTDGDVELLREHRVKVAHNPTSNMKLGSGRAPVQKMLQAGVLVAIGTDGTASNNDLDMLEETRLAAFLAKMEEAPQALPAATCLEMMTVYGAEALGFADVGRIAPGYQADLILVDTSGPHWTPLFDPAANLIYSGKGADVKTVVVAGELLMERGELKTVDEERVLHEVRQRAQRIARA